jgi:hypothetical protein
VSHSTHKIVLLLLLHIVKLVKKKKLEIYMIYWINLIDWNGHVRVSINLWIEEIYFKMHKFIQIFIIINSFKAWYNCWKVLIPKLVLFHIRLIQYIMYISNFFFSQKDYSIFKAYWCKTAKKRNLSNPCFNRFFKC